ncbi:MAG: hypothetical protein AAFQ54_08460 [Pseudomonadota bacterium]
MSFFAVNMTLLYVTAGALLVLVYIAFSLGVFPPEQAARRASQGFRMTLMGAAAVFFVFVAARETVRAPAAGIVVLGVMYLGIGLAIAGFGLLLGGLAAGSRPPLRRVLAILPLGIAAAVVWQVQTSIRAEQDALASARSAFLDGTIEATLAGRAVTIPVAPHLEITHACATRSGRVCRSNFLTGTTLNDAPSAPFDVFSLRLTRDFTNVAAAAEAWCAARPAIAGAIWCADLEDYTLVIRRAEGTDRERLRDKRMAIEDASESPTLRCQDHFAGPHCRLLIGVATGVIAELTFTGETEDAVLAQVEEGRSRAERIWAAIASP